MEENEEMLTFKKSLICTSKILGNLSEIEDIIKKNVINGEVYNDLIIKFGKSFDYLLKKDTSSINKDNKIKNELEQIKNENKDNSLSAENTNEEPSNIFSVANEEIFIIIKEKKIQITETINIMLLLGKTNLESQIKSQPSTKLFLCGKEFRPFEIHYHCFTCNRIKNTNLVSLYCKECFIIEKHFNHDYFFILNLHVGGTCDCGDSKWLDPSSFCSLHSANSEIKKIPIISEYEEKITIPLLKIILEQYNKEILKINNTNVETDEITPLFEQFKFLYDLNKQKWTHLFLNVLLNKTNNYQICNHYNFDSLSILKNICSCNIFDNLVRVIPLIPKSTHIVSLFLEDICKTFEEFRIELMKSLIKVQIDFIEKNNLKIFDNSDFLKIILIQSSWNEPQLIEFFRQNFHKYWFPCISILSKNILEKSDKQKTNDQILFFIEIETYMQNIFKSLANTILSNTLFLEIYVSAISDFTFYEYNNLLAKDLKMQAITLDDLQFENTNLFLKIFKLIFQGYQIEDKESNRKIFQYIYKQINALKLKSVFRIGQISSINLTIYRLLGQFLIKFLNKIPLPSIKINFANYFKDFFIEEFGISSVDIDDLAHEICFLILNEFKLIIQIITNCNITNYKFRKEVLSIYLKNIDLQIYESDVLLFQFFALLVDDKEIFGLFTFFFNPEENLLKCLKENIQLSSQYFLHILFQWMCLIGDDFSTVCFFYRSFYDRVTEKMPFDMAEVCNYLIKNMLQR